jgi:hypothetical protein
MTWSRPTNRCADRARFVSCHLLYVATGAHMLGKVRESQSTVTDGMSFLRLQITGQQFDPEKKGYERCFEI